MLPTKWDRVSRGHALYDREAAGQESPYGNLLRPRIGAIAFVLASLGDQLDGVLDTTIVYPGGEVTLWQFVSGRVPAIAVRVRRIDVPSEFLAPEITEPGPERDRFRAWIESRWSEKDARIASLRGTFARP